MKLPLQSSSSQVSLTITIIVAVAIVIIITIVAIFARPRCFSMLSMRRLFASSNRKRAGIPPEIIILRAMFSWCTNQPQRRSYRNDVSACNTLHEGERYCQKKKGGWHKKEGGNQASAGGAPRAPGDVCELHAKHKLIPYTIRISSSKHRKPYHTSDRSTVKPDGRKNDGCGSIRSATADNHRIDPREGIKWT